MGYGGRNTNFFINLFFSCISFIIACGALGHGDNENRHTPTPVKGLRDHPAVVSISSGYYFANALTETKELFNWGRGDYGVFGNGESKSLWIPKKNDYFAYLKDSEKLSIKTLKSANNYSVALMSDGNLYGWGSNESGQMGIKTEIGVEMYETANFATSVVNEMFKGKKIV
jgi:alpha-tubulin suppressor-like RCC1 family protein